MTERLSAEPRCAHTPPSPPESTNERPKSAEDLLQEEDDRIATELPRLPPAHHESLRQGRTEDEHWTLRRELVRSQTREEIEEEEAHRRLGFRYNRYRFVRERKRWYHPLLAWWWRNVSLKVDVAKRRDHLALERTFLGYLRTSLALSMTGVVIAQLFRLQHSHSPSLTFGYFVAGEPLAGCFIAASMVVVLVGAIRFWRQQSAMARGKVWAGGWEVYVIMALSMALCVALFAIALGVAIRHDMDD